MLFIGVVTNAVKLRCLLHYTLYQKITRSNWSWNSSNVFLTYIYVSVLSNSLGYSFPWQLFTKQLQVELVLFFNQFFYKSSKAAAAITTALSKLLRSQRQRVATLLPKKLAWEWKNSKKKFKSTSKIGGGSGIIRSLLFIIPFSVLFDIHYSVSSLSSNSLFWMPKP